MDTLEQFIEKLRQTPREWRVDTDGRIVNHDECCPLEAVYGTVALLGTGLAVHDRDNVLDGTDIVHPELVGDPPDMPYVQYRQQLLEACGINEKTESPQ